MNTIAFFLDNLLSSPAEIRNNYNNLQFFHNHHNPLSRHGRQGKRFLLFLLHGQAKFSLFPQKVHQELAGLLSYIFCIIFPDISIIIFQFIKQRSSKISICHISLSIMSTNRGALLYINADISATQEKSCFQDRYAGNGQWSRPAIHHLLDIF